MHCVGIFNREKKINLQKTNTKKKTHSKYNNTADSQYPSVSEFSRKKQKTQFESAKSWHFGNLIEFFTHQCNSDDYIHANSMYNEVHMHCVAECY